MPELILVPEVAAGATEATLLEWTIGEGDVVAVGDVIALLETDKAQVEITAEVAGTVARLLAGADADVLIGAPIAVVASDGDEQSRVDDFIAALGVPGSSSAPIDSRTVSQPHEEPAELRADTPTAGADGSSVRLFVSPIARRMLKDAGIDPAGVQGSGPGGRIVRRDVEAAVAASTVAEQAALASAPEPVQGSFGVDTADMPVLQGGTAVPHTRLRRAIARRLTQSKQTVPHFYLRRTVILDELLRLRTELNSTEGVRISINDLVVKAVARAQALVPRANVIWTDEHLVQFDRVDVAVAIASEQGLVTPVVRAVDRLSLGAISTQIGAFVKSANAGSLQQADLEGGAITVTNLGMFEVDEFSAIINPPHAAILAVGAGRPAPLVREGRVEIATQMNLVLSVDHRAIDGALAAEWMRVLVDGIEKPYSLLV